PPAEREEGAAASGRSRRVGGAARRGALRGGDEERPTRRPRSAAPRRGRRRSGARPSSAVLLGRVLRGRARGLLDELAAAPPGGPLEVKGLLEDHHGGDLVHDLAMATPLAAGRSAERRVGKRCRTRVVSAATKRTTA